MQTLLSGIIEGILLFFRGDPALWTILAASARVSGAALLISAILGVPLGAWMGLGRFPAQRVAHALIYTGMGVPPVVVGLAVYILLSNSGVLGPLHLSWVPQLFTIPAMVFAQVLIALPLVIGYTMASIAEVDPALRVQLKSLGATPLQITWTLLVEARRGVVVALVGGFGSIISEVGAVMMVGGNIEGSTRVLTTAIMLETRRGNFSLALGLGIVLLGLAFVINMIAAGLQGKGRA